MKRARVHYACRQRGGFAARGAGATELGHDRVSQQLQAAVCEDIHAMVNPSARAVLFKKRVRLLDPWPIGNLLLNCYLEGWAEPNPTTILAATAPGYHFHDPFVGSFFHSTLHEYFDLLQDRLSCAGVIRPTDVAFFLSGPVDRPAHAGTLQLWREAPRVGLSGVSEIEFGPQGVIAETVAYDLNLASDALRRAV